MRKRKLKTKLDYNDIIKNINIIIDIFLKYVDKNKIQFIYNEYILNNKIIQKGIIFKVIYKYNCIFSWFFPYNNTYILNINEEYIIDKLYYLFLNKLITFQADDFEQEFIANNINLSLQNKEDKDKLEILEEYKIYFNDKYKVYINSYILLYNL